MNIPSDLLQLLRMFALRKKSANFDFLSFYEYLQNYSRHYIEKKQELAVYLEISKNVLLEEIKKLHKNTGVEILSDKSNETIIFIPYFFIDNIAKRFISINERPDLPFPLASELPVQFPRALIEKIDLSDDFAQIEKAENGKNFLYELVLSEDVPAVVFPGVYTAEKMLSFSLIKIKLFLSKDENRDYMDKRLRMANPGKEFTVRKFISELANSSQSLNNIKNADESYILWGQFCAFVKKEFSKKNEKLVDEVALLQAICIVEYLNNYYRTQSQKGLQSKTALKNLFLAFKNKPYYFTMSQIIKFVDSKGIPLLGQYTEEELQAFMKDKTVNSEKYIVPDILTFKNEKEERFYVLAEKAVPLLISLINEARKPVRDACIKKWYTMLSNFEQDDSMKNDYAFSNFVKAEVLNLAPNLYALLGSSFFSILITEPRLDEIQISEIHRIFPNGKLVSYSNMLMLDRQELFSDAKILLPFWYTIPIISSIINFFKRSRKIEKKNSSEKKNIAKNTVKKTSLKEIVENITSDFVPQGMTLDESLKKYLDLWNQNLNEEARNNLTDDVNSLIKDYIRGIQRTLSSSNFSADRVRSLAKTLVETPSLLKIKHRNPLENYISLYILKLLK